MRIDGFVKVTGIPGDSVRDGHEDEIEVHGVEFGMTAPYDPAALSRRGRVSIGPLTFTKVYDRSSPYLKKALFSNTRIEEVVFSARRTVEGETSDYLVVVLTDTSVVSYALGPSEEEPDVLEERISFAYRTIRFRYDDSHEVEMDVAAGR